MLDGVFAFVLYDTRDRTYVAARDAIGVNPLYIGWGSDGTISLAEKVQTERGILAVRSLSMRCKFQTR